MKKILIKSLFVCLGVLVLPLVFTLILSPDSDNDFSFDNINFEIYYEKDGSKEQIDFTEYLVGVIAANMPAGYQLDALKAQAVIARTYALHNVSLLLDENPSKRSFTTSELGLSYIGLDEMDQYWEEDMHLDYFTKLENAVFATEDEVLTYDGELILPMFFYTGSGYTRNASEAWGIDVPYLVSVSSKQDVTSINYLKISEYEVPEICQILQSYYKVDIAEDSFFDTVKVLERDSAGYVIEMGLGDQTVSGEEFAKVIGLNSNHFYIEDYENKARIVCTGVGHGIGLSQYGANTMADNGHSYKEILNHYYPGAKLSILSQER